VKRKGSWSSVLTDLFSKGRIGGALGKSDRDCLEASLGDVASFGPRKTIIERGERAHKFYYLIEGVTLKYRDDKRGERQIVGLNMPGDFIEYDTFVTDRLPYSIGTLDGAVVSSIPVAAMRDLMMRSSRLEKSIWIASLLEAAVYRQWIIRVGSMRAESRLANLICELAARAKMVGLFDGQHLPIRLLQRDYAEACGITSNHTNRVFRSLRERGALDVEDAGKVLIKNEALLKRIAQFDSTYLYPATNEKIFTPLFGKPL